MEKKNQRWYSVDGDGSEYQFNKKPVRNTGVATIWQCPTPYTDFKQLYKGTIERITGKKLTWDDEPLEWWDNKEQESYNFQAIYENVIEVFRKFAFDQITEKNKDIEYWKNETIEANNQLVDAGNYVVELKEQIELKDKEIKDIKDAYEYINRAYESAVSELHDAHKRIEELDNIVEDKDCRISNLQGASAINSKHIIELDEKIKDLQNTVKRQFEYIEKLHQDIKNHTIKINKIKSML